MKEKETMLFKKTLRLLVGTIVLITVAMSSLALAGYGDHDGPYDEPGIHATDPEIKGWATGVADSSRPDGVNFGAPGNVLGAPGGTFDTYSLGDGGHITVMFDPPIANGPGPDFAVWENGHVSIQPGTEGLLFAELMFVEVSSDGVHFIRFPSVNLIPDDQVPGGFGVIDPTYVLNVAGKHPNGNGEDQGTPFDLDDLLEDPKVLSDEVDLTHIRYVRLVDVIGDGSTTDSQGNPMWDPYPTPFGTGGADPDAVGVLNEPRENSPPEPPELVFPEDGEAEVSASPTLVAGAFFDVDTDLGEYHLKSEWQVATSPVFDSGIAFQVQSHTSLTSILLPAALLDPDTHYFWRVRFFDSYGVSSAWSEVFSFTTAEHVDAAGIPEDQQLDPSDPEDVRVDLNQDDTPDVNQLSGCFKVFRTVVGQGYMALGTPPDVTIEHVEARDPALLPDSQAKPDTFVLSLISFRVTVSHPGDSASLVVYFSQPIPENYQWYKYDASQGWYVFPGAVFSVDRVSVRVNVKDGGTGDADGVANGVIIDPAGAGATTSISAASTASARQVSAGGVGGCFINVCWASFSALCTR
ncbi:MAG: hypothetical protein JRI36_07910 [Deltaproteobacteria bacterium]|nr:hypothetical protein [Deltaproteobacteria bacterium]